MTYLSNVKYVPIPGSTLEKFIGEINNVFAQLAFAGNPVNDVNKLGLIRSAIKKGSKRYNETLKLCEFAGKSYQETLDKLHDQDIKYSMFQYSESHSKNEGNKRRNEDESLTITTTNNNNSNSNKSNKFPGYCSYCGKYGHKADMCFTNPSNKNKNNNSNKNQNSNSNKESNNQSSNSAKQTSSNNKNKKSNARKYDKGVAEKNSLKAAFKNKVKEQSNQSDEQDESSLMHYEHENQLTQLSGASNDAQSEGF
jgi:hypothetical protein